MRLLIQYIAAGAAAIGFLLFLSSVGKRNSSTPPAQTIIAKAPPLTKEDLVRAYEQKKRDNRDLILLKDVRFTNNYGLWSAGFRLKNYGKFDAKDIILECEFIGQSGTTISSRRLTLFRSLGRESEIRVRPVEIGLASSQAVAGRCSVADFEYDLEAMKRKASRP